MLSSPIILYDHPAIAPESPGDLFDAIEIDEILSLRTLALTDEEKREARATDPRGGAMIDRAETLPPELLERLHGAVRQLRPVPAAEHAPTCSRTEQPWWDPGADASVDPATDTVVVAGTRSAGAAGCACARAAGAADAQDMFLAGRVATVEAVLLDVDGSTHLAVTLDDDPARRPADRCRAGSATSPPTRSESAWTRGVSGRRGSWSPGVGNIFLGDDGFGVEVASRLAGRALPAWLGSATSASAASTWPTSCWPATTRPSWSTSTAGVTRRARCGCWRSARPTGRPGAPTTARCWSTRTACSRSGCWTCSTAAAAPPGGCCWSAASRPT